MKSVRELCTICNMLGYAEILPISYATTIRYKFLNEITEKNFSSVAIKQKQDLWTSLKQMLKKELKEA